MATKLLIVRFKINRALRGELGLEDHGQLEPKSASDTGAGQRLSQNRCVDTHELSRLLQGFGLAAGYTFCRNDAEYVRFVLKPGVDRGDEAIVESDAFDFLCHRFLWDVEVWSNPVKPEDGGPEDRCVCVNLMGRVDLVNADGSRVQERIRDARGEPTGKRRAREGAHLLCVADDGTITVERNAASFDTTSVARAQPNVVAAQ